MKLYPLINVKSIPSGYKHCKNVFYIKICFQNVEAFIQKEKKKENYLKQVEEEMYNVIEANFIGAQSTHVVSHDQHVCIFKSNIDQRMLETFITNLCKEVDSYVNHTLTYSFIISEALLYEEGKTPTIFASTKLGEDLFASTSYQKDAKAVDVNKKGRYAKYLTSYDEYRDEEEEIVIDYCI